MNEISHKNIFLYFYRSMQGAIALKQKQGDRIYLTPIATYTSKGVRLLLDSSTATDDSEVLPVIKRAPRLRVK